MSSTKKWALIIFTSALLARLLVFGALLERSGEKGLILGDIRYLTLGQNLASGNGYTYEGTESYRPPGYPAYLFIFEYLGLPLWSVSLVQIIIASLIPLGVFMFVAKKTDLSGRSAKAAGFMAAFEPIQVFYSAVILPDVLFGVSFLVSIFLLIRWMEKKNFRWAAYAGLSMGLTNYFRPTDVYFGVLGGAILAGYFLWRKSLSRKTLLQLGIFAAMSLIVLVPWQIRNKLVFGNYSFVSASASNLYIYGAAAAKAVGTGVPYEQVRRGLWDKVEQEAPEPRYYENLKNADYMMARSKEIILKYPVAYLKTYVLGLNTFWFSGNYHYLLMRYGFISPPEGGTFSFSLILAGKGVAALFEKFFQTIFSPYVMLAVLGKLLWLVLTIGAVWGAWHIRRQALGAVFLVCVVYFSATILSVTIGVEARHRYMINPLTFILFFYGWLAARASFFRLKRR